MFGSTNTTSSSTLIALFIATIDTGHIALGIVDAGISDHLVISLFNKSDIVKHTCRRPLVTFQNFTKYRRDNFRTAISVVDWSDVLQKK